MAEGWYASLCACVNVRACVMETSEGGGQSAAESDEMR